MNGPGVREAKIETAICQYAAGWLTGKPQVSTAECPALFPYETETAATISTRGLGTAWRNGVSGRAPLTHFCSRWDAAARARRHFCPEDHQLPAARKQDKSPRQKW